MNHEDVISWLNDLYYGVVNEITNSVISTDEKNMLLRDIKLLRKEVLTTGLYRFQFDEKIVKQIQEELAEM